MQRKQNRWAFRNNSSKAKKILIVSLTLCLTVGIGIWAIDKYLNPNKKLNDKTIAMYIQNEEGTYIESSETQFPTDGYVLNVEKSSCRNGGTITQDASTKKIRLIASKTDTCLLYFDKHNPVADALAKLGLTSRGTLTNFDEIAPKPTQYKDDGFIGSQNNYDMTNYRRKNYTYADSYTFDTNTGLYSLTNPQFCQYLAGGCYTYLRGKYIGSLSGNTPGIETSNNLKTIYKVGTETTTTSLPYIESSKTILSYDYSKDGIYEMEDDYGTSYYYRGAVENNYVKFGKNKSGQDMFWRIIRINGDGTLRIIYDGTSAHANGENSTDRVALAAVAWNTNVDDAKYVGYMYGGVNGEVSTSKEQAQANETSSNIKTQLDTWYKENIVDTGYGNAVSDEIFCNDRSFANDNTGPGYGTSTTYYGARGRVGNGVSNPQPSFKCSEKNDAFTVRDKTNGNGALTYPVGLITADEITTSGGRLYQSNGSTNNYKYYLYKGKWYWSLSPSSYDGYAYGLIMDTHGDLSSMYGSGGVVPVINLSAEYVNTLIGTGTTTDPYRSA